MASEHSFDIVSKVDHQEVDNAINQAAREVGQRFDFKDTATTVKWAADAIDIESSTPERATAALDVLRSKLARRGVNLKSLEASEPRISGKRAHISCTLAQGISQENAKKIVKLIKDEGPKAVRPLIQGDELRVSSKSLDDLQAVQALVKGADFDFAVQFTNYR
ncbi:MAG: YajQ family cyclic di-GMP-binding protein [Propionibacteriaceae bacterium]|jgi:uncharacterized protein YajQ (UPF0234 family)|nr:YajQ family cyclic di-GMP-binding protein [Propionibacteriaceae bacterium]